MEDNLLWKDELHEECGVVGCFGVDRAASVACQALMILQHRGQQGCGIAALGADGDIRLHKHAGLVREVFGEQELASLPGTACIGHVRYPTTEVGGAENLQPFKMTGKTGTFALAHNGNIVNADILRRRSSRRDISSSPLRTASCSRSWWERPARDGRRTSCPPCTSWTEPSPRSS